MFRMLKTRKYILPTFQNKIHTMKKNPVILSMTPNGERWHCLAVKELSALLRGRTSNYDGDFYCLNSFHSFRTKNKLESHKKGKNKDFSNIVTPSKNTKILKFKIEQMDRYKASPGNHGQQDLVNIFCQAFACLHLKTK